MKPQDWILIVIMTMLLGLTTVTVKKFQEVNTQLEIIKIEIKQIYNDLIFEE